MSYDIVAEPSFELVSASLDFLCPVLPRQAAVGAFEDALPEAGDLEVLAYLVDSFQDFFLGIASPGSATHVIGDLAEIDILNSDIEGLWRNGGR